MFAFCKKPRPSAAHLADPKPTSRTQTKARRVNPATADPVAVGFDFARFAAGPPAGAGGLVIGRQVGEPAQPVQRAWTPDQAREVATDGRGGAETTQSLLSAQRNPGATFAKATRGAHASLPHRGEMESAFGVDLSSVRAVAGGAEAEFAMSVLGARAAAHGRNVVFAERTPDRPTVAHEVAHVIQQDGHLGATPPPPTHLSAPGAPAELRAHAAAEAAAAGRKAPDVGDGADGALHRLATFGGEWSTGTYNTFTQGGGLDGGDEMHGCNISLSFMPNDLVNSPQIGLVQTVRSSNAGVDDGVVWAGRRAGDDQRLATSTHRAIDQFGSPSPSGPDDQRGSETTPIYGMHNPPGNLDITAGANPRPGGGSSSRIREATWGSRGRGFPTRPAWLGDHPRELYLNAPLRIAFETAAVSIAPPQAGTYYGSVQWGFETGASRAPQPLPLEVVSMGTPSGDFMSAASNWNAGQVTVGGTLTDTVDLPTTTHVTEDPTTPSADDRLSQYAALNDRQLRDRIAALNVEVRAATAGSPERRNAEFERAALQAEQRRRTGSRRR